jgi:2-succinyl-5-enolpyruvyl-6-hydroxy-3-cyclohexene-1-carboxylate synthase
MNYTKALTYYLGAFVDELQRLNVRDVVISPGSRSTPLAILLAEHEQIQTYLHVDERSAAFFALGMAKAKQRPVAVLCTSGTAAANYMPAVSEAAHSRVPLLILTADRPHELRDVGAPQAMNQLHLFGSFVKSFIEMALPEASERMYQYVRTTAARAVSALLAPPMGPVHLNFPLREPLVPNLELPNLWEAGRLNRMQHVSLTVGKGAPDQQYTAELVGRLASKEKGIIVCGDHDDSHFAGAVTKLAVKLGYPILADPLSQLRSGGHVKEYVVDCYDTFLRNETIRQDWKPDVILRFGAMPVSKALTQYIAMQKDADIIVVDEAADWRDPTLMSSEMVYANEALFCEEICAAVAQREETSWLRSWMHVNNLTKQRLQTIDTYEDVFEGRVITELTALLPHSSTLFVGNSMPIRDTDTFFFTNDKQIKVMANRGVNGIDGIVSSALGASVASSPLVLVLGDLSFYHDLNGLLAAKLHKLNATIVVLNNDGGGIFSFLPQYAEKKHFEALFGTPLGLDYELVVKMYDGRFTRVRDWDEFRDEVKQSIQTDGLHVIEVRTDRERNLEMHRSLWNSISTELTSLLKDENAK